MCVGACKDESHALAQFKMHAVGTCHDELLAAEAMATMVARVAFDGTPFGAVLGVLAPFARLRSLQLLGLPLALDLGELRVRRRPFARHTPICVEA